jgi:hypothetical protein
MGAPKFAAFLLLACLLSATAADEPPPDGEPPAGDLDRAEFESRVNAAIERGAAWLKTQQRNDGSYPRFADRLNPGTYDPMDLGLIALVALTLAHCGVPADDDSIQRAFRWCQSEYSKMKKNGKVMVYAAATLLMALDAIHNQAVPEPEVKRDRYGAPVPPAKPPPCKYTAASKAWVEELVAFLVKSQVLPCGGWRYPDNPVGSVEGATDLSNTQYAILGLDAAARCGFSAPEETWRKAAEYALTEQEEEGIETPVYMENESWKPGDDPAKRLVEAAQVQAKGWSYLPDRTEPPTGAMTCAGITILAVAKERLWALKKLDPAFSRKLDGGILSGLGWLSEHFTVEDNPDPPAQWHYYYLYGLERVGAKTGVRWIGTNDWYRAGADHLLAAQTPEGGWPESAMLGKPADHTESAITQTCFALLFLKRATRRPWIPVTPPVLTGSGEPPADNR